MLRICLVGVLVSAYFQLLLCNCVTMDFWRYRINELVLYVILSKVSQVSSFAKNSCASKTSLSASKTFRNGQSVGNFSDANAFNGRISISRYTIWRTCYSNFVKCRLLVVDFIVFHLLAKFYGLQVQEIFALESEVTNIKGERTDSRQKIVWYQSTKLLPGPLGLEPKRGQVHNIGKPHLRYSPCQRAKNMIRWNGGIWSQKGSEPNAEETRSSQ